MEHAIRRRMPVASSALDRLRALRAGELMRDGVRPAEAMWRIMTDPSIGIRRWRQTDNSRLRERPVDRALEARMLRLIQRAFPEYVDDCRLRAGTILLSAAENAARCFARAVEGEHAPTTGHAFVQLKASEKVLQALGFFDTRPVQSDAEGGPSTDPDKHSAAMDAAQKILDSHAKVRDADQEPAGMESLGPLDLE